MTTISDVIFAIVLGVFLAAVAGYAILLLVGAWKTLRGHESRPPEGPPLWPWYAPVASMRTQRRWRQP